MLKAVIVLKRRAQSSKLAIAAKKAAAADALNGTDETGAADEAGAAGAGAGADEGEGEGEGVEAEAEKGKSGGEKIRDRVVLKRGGSREEKILEGQQRLLERLNHHRLDDVQMVDDGNCQFRALSEQCYGSPKYHYAIRLRTVEQMEASSEQYKVSHFQ